MGLRKKKILKIFTNDPKNSERYGSGNRAKDGING